MHVWYYSDRLSFSMKCQRSYFVSIYLKWTMFCLCYMILHIVIFDQINTNILYWPIPIDASQQMRMTIYALSVLSLCSEYLIGCVTARMLKMYKMKSWILSSTFKFISHMEKFFEQSNMFMHSKSNHWKIFVHSAYFVCCFFWFIWIR